MIFSLLFIHNYERRSSITVLHAATWNIFISHLPSHFFCSPNVVMEAIMTDIHDLVQEFWRTSTDGADGESIFAMCRLHKILGRCLEVCFFWRLLSIYLIKPRCSQTPISSTGMTTKSDSS